MNVGNRQRSRFWQYGIAAVGLVALAWIAQALIPTAEQRLQGQVLERPTAGLELRAQPPLWLLETAEPGPDPARGDGPGERRLRAYQAAHLAAEGSLPGGSQALWFRPGPSGWSVGFVLPGDRPAPMATPDSGIRIQALPAQRVAAVAFGGRWSPVRFAEQRQNLLRDLQKAGMRPLGEPWLVREGRDWLPGPLRRNEVRVVVSVD